VLAYNRDGPCAKQDLQQMSQLRNSALIGALAAAAFATWLLGRQEPPVVVASGVSEPRTFYLRDAAILGTDSSGYVSYRVFATMVEQPEQDEPIELREVRVEYDPREQIPWLATAARATLSKDESMRLHEARLSTLPERDAAATVIETDELELDAATYVARAEQPVVLSRGSVRVEAQRLNADLKQNRIVLERGHGRLHR
jgi:LPS export ABC transporter protein LptC